MTEQGIDPIVLYTLLAEAAGESPEGMYYVASSMQNRANRKKQNLRQVVDAPNQYAGRWRPDLEQFAIRQPEATRAMATQAIVRAMQEPAPGITNYLTTQLFNSDKSPGWSRKMKVLKQLGGHTFLGE